jgi:hypothetical protein
VFEDDGHSVYALDQADVVSLVPPAANLQAALLPGRSTATGDLLRLLTDASRGLPAASHQADSQPYRQRLELDEIGQPTIQAGVAQGGARYIAGGLSASFSDMLGDRSLGLAAQIGGGVADLGAEVIYVNRKHRWNWATSAGILPYAIGYLTRSDDLATGTVTIEDITLRQTCRCASAATTTRSAATRVEPSIAAQGLSFT